MDEFKYFKIEEFDCQETGENEMDVSFIHRLDQLRENCGFPFSITSGFRSKEHSIEKRKAKPGTHAKGIAADIYHSDGVKMRTIVEEALEMGFTGVGIHHLFIHVDDRVLQPLEKPRMWCY